MNGIDRNVATFQNICSIGKARLSLQIVPYISGVVTVCLSFFARFKNFILFTIWKQKCFLLVRNIERNPFVLLYTHILIGPPTETLCRITL